MAVKYSKTFVATNSISREAVTVIVECVEAKDFQGVSIETFEGAHNPTTSTDKLSGFIPLILSDARQLADALNEALQAAS